MAYEPWQPGMNITVDRLLSISPTWQDWTPTWTTTTGLATPAFGNAALTCRYAVSARTCWGHFNVVFGSTTNFGTTPTNGDNWQFSLPVAGASVQEAIGYGTITKTTSKRHVVRFRMLTATQFGLEIDSGAPDGLDTTADGATGGGKGLADSMSPWSSGSAGTTWATGYAVRGTFCYETAA